jgi:hypothetical protein
VGHFIQQGWDYYQVYLSREAGGESREQVMEAVLFKGVGQEKGVFGELSSGVFSNADLASNYAGLKFLLNLTRPVRIGKQSRSAVLIVTDDRWVFNPHGPDDLLRAFVSDHWDEARNPSRYDGLLRGEVERNTARRIGRWLEFHQTTVEAEARRLPSMEHWFGEDYGHSGWENVITIEKAWDSHVAARQADAAGGSVGGRLNGSATSFTAGFRDRLPGFGI